MPIRGSALRRGAAALVTAAVVVTGLVAAAGAASAQTACATPWAAGTAYSGGAQVSYSGSNFQAKWWTQNETPGASAWGAWESLGTCGTTTPDPEPTPTPTAEPTAEPTPTPTPTTEPTPAPAEPWTKNPDEQCRPDGLYQTPGVDVPYCTVYDTAGREKPPNGLEHRVIGYFTSWRTGANGQPAYLASDIPWTKLSHINYAFAHIGDDGRVSVNQDAAGNPATDMTWPGVAGAEMDPAYEYRGHFNLLSKYKKQNPGVKALVSVGGWAETGGHFGADGTRVADGGFYTLTDSQAKIDAFAESAVQFIRTYGFDGVDIDYEYANSNGKAGSPDDFSFSEPRRAKLWAGYQSLMKTLREKLDRAGAADGHHYMLTVAAPASGWLLRGAEAHQILQYLDYVNIMSYDLHGSWNNYVGGNAALFDDGKDPELAAGGVYNAYSNIGYLNTDWAYHYFRGAMPAGRINVGVPFYTRGWDGVQGGTDGLYGSAPLADQTKCPAGTGPSLGGTSKCGAGAVGINNLWHDLDKSGGEVGAGANPIWHVLNLEKGVVGDYTASYGAPTTITGSYTRHFDQTTKVEWWWNAQTRTFLSGDADQAIKAKADYVADRGIGGVMIWELAGDYDYNQAKGQYEMGETLVDLIHDRLAASTPYGATKADVAMPEQALDLQVSYSDFALGDNNYPINPKVTFTNNSKIAIPAGATITFDTGTSDTGAMGEQNGWGLTKIASDHTGSNVGGLKGDFHTYSLKVPAGGIAPGASAWTKLSWRLPMAQLSNVRVKIGDQTYGALYDFPRDVTLAQPGTPSTGGGSGGTGTCAADAWSATAVYTGGAKVSRDGATYTAKWWTQGDIPGTAQVWGEGVPC